MENPYQAEIELTCLIWMTSYSKNRTFNTSTNQTGYMEEVKINVIGSGRSQEPCDLTQWGIKVKGVIAQQKIMEHMM
jgi:hypothetical protein